MDPGVLRNKSIRVNRARRDKYPGFNESTSAIRSSPKRGFPSPFVVRAHEYSSAGRGVRARAISIGRADGNRCGTSGWRSRVWRWQVHCANRRASAASGLLNYYARTARVFWLTVQYRRAAMRQRNGGQCWHIRDRRGGAISTWSSGLSGTRWHQRATNPSE